MSSAIEERIRAAFARQSFMAHLGAELTRVERGLAELTVRRNDRLLQQHGFMHAGVTTSVLDTACGVAALSVMDEESGVLSVEFKVNLLAPASGESFLARGEVLREGRTIVVCRGDAFSLDGDSPRLIAVMQATMMAVKGREGIRD
jgi:uncharacterized protein (TIGR00369 family)